MKLSVVLAAGTLVGCLLMTVGCEPMDDDGGDSSSPAASPSASSVGENPQIGASSGQSWSFGYKEYDQTFRIRWPSYFATDLGVGPGSYCLVNGEVARFRSYDTDEGSKRPSYTLPGPSDRFGAAGTELTIVLHSAGGEPLAWFKTRVQGEGAGMISGRLP